MGSPNFTAPPPDPEPPAVDAFLSAVDHAMNSNTLLLTTDCDVPVVTGNRQDVLHAFLRSALFERLMRAADVRRNWYNLTDGNDSEPLEHPLLREGFHATISPLDAAGFLARLRWMLCEAFSPYGHHYPAADAEQLARGFARELLGTDDPAWSFAAVSPDFLRSTGYYSDEQPQPPVYFDGGGSDTATFVHRGRTFHLLLTNGSP
ncbi:hypothetical protein [Streptomyces monashensis]|uniref:Uncharacterized protein n=1 Tax=Streptomyces monashensis TaxID=1678012 RepID=A0A1S2PCH6_9ACTN|nr:hypothetical protein [Streptomyces monashensis]OIJ91302.1 hypothetical protein BIV23_39820 [Streptomyces monashensis]